MPLSRSPLAEEAAASAQLNGGTAERSLRRRFVEAARRAAIIGLVNAATSESVLARRYIDELCEVFDTELACMIDGGDERRPTRAMATVGMESESAAALFKHPECARAIESGRALVLAGEDVLGLGARGGMLAPFRTEDGRPIVTLLARMHPTPFNETDRAMLEAVAVAAGQATERIWAYEARNRSAREQAALLRAAKSIGTSLEFTDVLNTVA